MPTRRKSGSPFFRREAVREPYDRVLIVCEGEKTEPNYLRDLMVVHRLSSANVSVVSPGSDPVTLVEHAQKRLADFDRVFCVFDGEHVDRVAKAKSIIERSPEGKKERWKPIVSYPCFEIWLQLHFRYSAAPFAAGGGRTVGEVACVGLRPYLPAYQKGTTGLYSNLLDKVELAIQNGKRLSKHNQSTQSYNPSTQMHELVEYLRGLKRPALTN
jgi:hypothetical protein